LEELPRGHESGIVPKIRAALVRAEGREVDADEESRSHIPAAI
jgi:hypothetical protein